MHKYPKSWNTTKLKKLIMKVIADKGDVSFSIPINDKDSTMRAIHCRIHGAWELVLIYAEGKERTSRIGTFRYSSESFDEALSTFNGGQEIEASAYLKELLEAGTGSGMDWVSAPDFIVNSKPEDFLALPAKGEVRKQDWEGIDPEG